MRLHSSRLTATAVMLTAVLAGPAGATGQTAEAPLRQDCTAPALPGKIVDVTLNDDTGSDMMGNGPPAQDMRMTLSVKPSTVPAGTVSLRVFNKSTNLAHEAVVLPLPSGQSVGKRAVGSGQRVDEKGSFGEAARNCGPGEGEGIAPGSMSWTTLTLRPGQYEVVCNFPGHYAAGMYAKLTVTNG
ncbi:plastocyanin/azurin family copper-binding protein [Nonomuraea sp. NPDC048916]|uniref:plastocyanin/azurin family copper-binding protein n=1 Tax=Nonomuraea sp. NPDC048916 TaxID=3154232 RepID=UPI003411E55F